MQIGLVWDSEYPWDVRVEKITHSFINAGHEVHLICRNRTAQVRYEFAEGLHIHRLPYAGKQIDNITSFPFFGNPVWLTSIQKVVKACRIEALIVRDIPMALAGICIGRLRQIPCYVDMAEPYPEMLAGYQVLQRKSVRKTILNWAVRNPWLAQSVEHLACKLASHVFPVSVDLQKNLIRKLVPSEKISVVHNTPLLSDFPAPMYDISESDPRYDRNVQLTVAYIGDLTEARGLPLVIEGMSRVKQLLLPIKMIIIGGGRYESRIRQLIQDWNLSDHIHCTGWVSHREAYARMSKADVGLIPHLQTAHNHLTVPNKIFDYMAGHLPVLSARLESLEEILEKTGSGLVFHEYTVESFVETLLQLRDPVVRFKLGQKGRIAFRSQYHWEQDFSTMHGIVTGRDVSTTQPLSGSA